MLTPIVQPDIELWVTAYLRTQLPLYGYDNVRLSTKYKGNDREVVVRRDGGPRQHIVLEAQRLGVNVYAKSDTDVAVSDLSLAVAALLVACADGDPVVQAEQIGGMSAIPDPAATRRFMSFELTTRGIDLAHGIGANGLFPLDGTNDPWRWAPGGPWWVGPAYEVTWLAGDEVPIPTLPVGGESVFLYVIDATTYLEARSVATEDSLVTSGSSAPLVKSADGSGIAFLAQVQPGYSDVMDAPPNPELDVTTMLGDVTVTTAPPPPGLDDYDGTNDPWRWAPGEAWWVGPAFEVTWLTGDEVSTFTLPVGATDARLYVTEGLTYPERDGVDWTDRRYLEAGEAPMVMAADGSGIAFLVQYQTGYSEVRDEPPTPALDVTTMLGDVTEGAAYDFPEPPLFYPWPEA